jgi:putative Holliday junction resolvase
MRILGLDLGERRIGVALSDASGWLATPLTVLTATASRSGGKSSHREGAGASGHQLGETELTAIANLVQKHQVQQLVVGYPRSLSGDVGPQAQRVDSYVAQLRARLPDVPVILWDERLSTAQAERLIHEAGRRVQREQIDAAAAAVILQSYLDARQARPALGQGN